VSRVAIVGSRGYSELAKVAEYILNLPADTVVISGGARGVDLHAAKIARAAGLAVKEWLPDYAAYPGSIAPLKRNEQIAADCDHIAVFWDGTSTGCMHALTIAKALGKTWEVIR